MGPTEDSPLSQSCTWGLCWCHDSRGHDSQCQLGTHGGMAWHSCDCANALGCSILAASWRHMDAGNSSGLLPQSMPTCVPSGTARPSPYSWAAPTCLIDDNTAEMATCSIPRLAAQCRVRQKVKKAAFHMERAHQEEHSDPSDTPHDTYCQMRWLWHRAGRPTDRD